MVVSTFIGYANFNTISIESISYRAGIYPIINIQSSLVPIHG